MVGFLPLSELVPLAVAHPGVGARLMRTLAHGALLDERAAVQRATVTREPPLALAFVDAHHEPRERDCLARLLVSRAGLSSSEAAAVAARASVHRFGAGAQLAPPSSRAVLIVLRGALALNLARVTLRAGGVLRAASYCAQSPCQHRRCSPSSLPP
jgi:hypothetical protein